MTQPLEFAELEQVYELLAAAIDAVGPDNESLFLTKLCITLAHRSGDLVAVREALEIAARGLSA
jgi:hypothetical protein